MLEISTQVWEVEKLKAVDAVKLEQKEEFNKKLDELDQAQKINIEHMIQKAAEEMKQKFDEDRKEALKAQKQDLTLKAKRDLEALRTRFKMMQTTGVALDRSPSVSESDSMSVEVSEIHTVQKFQELSTTDFTKIDLAQPILEQEKITVLILYQTKNFSVWVIINY